MPSAQRRSSAGNFLAERRSVLQPQPFAQSVVHIILPHRVWTARSVSCRLIMRDTPDNCAEAVDPDADFANEIASPY